MGQSPPARRGNFADAARTMAATTSLLSQTLIPMHTLLPLALPIAAIGYSLVYMLFGGGIFGALVIFLIAHMFRR